MIIVVDLTNKKHVMATSLKDAWRTITREWADDLFEREREYSFEKLYGESFREFYDALYDKFGHEAADSIERSVSDMIIDADRLDEDDYFELIEGLGDTYIIDLRDETGETRKVVPPNETI